MKKEDLMNGDIAVLRDGYPGVFIKRGDGPDDGYILYQEIGMDDMYLFNDDLTLIGDDSGDYDIMEAHRGTYFHEIDMNDSSAPAVSRDFDRKRPSISILLDKDEVQHRFPNNFKQTILSKKQRISTQIKRDSLFLSSVKLGRLS